MRLGRAPLVIALISVFALLAACGGDDSDSADGAVTSTETTAEDTSSTISDGGEEGSATDPCLLLDAADLQAAFGSPFDGGEHSHLDQTGADQCNWTNTDPPPVKTFSITVYTEGGLSEQFRDAGITVQSLFRQTRDLAEESGPVEDVDLGDEAYLSGTKLDVLAGETSYSFSTFLGDSPEAIAGLRQLAAKALAS